MPSDTADGYDPSHGHPTAREQLAFDLKGRYKNHFDPTIVWVNGAWHYALTATETLCGVAIPDPVRAAHQSDWPGPSSVACRDCRPTVGRINKRDLRSLVLQFTDADRTATNTNGFTRDGLLAILQRLETYERLQRRGGDDAE